MRNEPRRDLPRLNPAEAAEYDDLRYQRLRPSLRLEQARVGFDWVQQALAAPPPLSAPLASLALLPLNVHRQICR